MTPLAVIWARSFAGSCSKGTGIRRGPTCAELVARLRSYQERYWHDQENTRGTEAPFDRSDLAVVEARRERAMLGGLLAEVAARERQRHPDIYAEVDRIRASRPDRVHQDQRARRLRSGI